MTRNGAGMPRRLRRGLGFGRGLGVTVDSDGDGSNHSKGLT
jgi:hypothetical protein